MREQPDAPLDTDHESGRAGHADFQPQFCRRTTGHLSPGCLGTHVNTQDASAITTPATCGVKPNEPSAADLAKPQ
jgi:hypothetical protein